MDINTIRLDAFRRGIRNFPTRVAFARKYGLDSTYLSQLLNGLAIWAKKRLATSK